MKGYFWVSYYDANFGKALAVFNGVESAGDYDAIYQYDALGRSAWIAADGSGQAWYANRFTCAGSGDGRRRPRSTRPCPARRTRCGWRARCRASPAAPAAATGTIAVGGYHTIRLQQPAAVTAGDTFVVAVRVATPGWTEPVPVEAPSELIAPRARAGQSLRERRRVVVDRPDRPDDAPRSRARERVPQGVRGRGRRRRHPAAARGPSRGGIVRRGAQADDPLAARRPGLLQRQRDRRAQRARRRRQGRGPPADPGGRRRASAGCGASTANWPQGRYSVRGRAYDVAGGRQATATRAAVLVRGVAPAAGCASLRRRRTGASQAGAGSRQAPARPSGAVGYNATRPRRRRRAGRSACPASGRDAPGGA